MRQPVQLNLMRSCMITSVTMFRLSRQGWTRLRTLFFAYHRRLRFVIVCVCVFVCLCACVFGVCVEVRGRLNMSAINRAFFTLSPNKFELNPMPTDRVNLDFGRGSTKIGSSVFCHLKSMHLPVTINRMPIT